MATSISGKSACVMHWAIFWSRFSFGGLPHALEIFLDLSGLKILAPNTSFPPLSYNRNKGQEGRGHNQPELSPVAPRGPPCGTLPWASTPGPPRRTLPEPPPDLHAGRPPGRTSPRGDPRPDPGPPRRTLPRASTRDAPRADPTPRPRASMQDPLRAAPGLHAAPAAGSALAGPPRTPPADWKASGARPRTSPVDHRPEAPGRHGPQCHSGLGPPPPRSRPPAVPRARGPASSPADQARTVARCGLPAAPAPPAPPAHDRRARLPAGRLRASSSAPRRAPRLGPPPPPRTRRRLACGALGRGLYVPSLAARRRVLTSEWTGRRRGERGPAESAANQQRIAL